MNLPTLRIRSVIEKVKSIFQLFIVLLGWVTLFAIVLSFTNIPFKIYYWLATKGADLKKRPDYIVMLGGVGMPSPEDLIRIYTTAGAWKEVPDSKVIIAFPPDTLLKGCSPELLMARDLIMRGVDSTRILFEREGISTRTQGQNIAALVGLENLDSVGIRIVTSPEHMFRAVRSFRKIGFRYVGGSPAFEVAINENRLIQGKKTKSEKRFLNIRYNMWSYLKYEITILREFCAIGYYKVRGWI